MRAGHPYVVNQTWLLLWSINERLAGRPGVDCPVPTEDWIEDLLTENAKEDQTSNDLEDTLGL